MIYRDDIKAKVYESWQEMPSIPEIPAVNEILEDYYKKQGPNKNMLPLEERAEFVKKLQAAYEKTPIEKRGDILVPADVKFVEFTLTKKPYRKDRPKEERPAPVFIYKRTIIGTNETEDHYGIRYAWPDNEGFRNGVKGRIELVPGMLFDRLGAPNEALFVAPLSEIGKAMSISRRALPYYFTDDIAETHHAYHVYRVKKRFVVGAISPNNTIFFDNENGELSYVEVGVVASAFSINSTNGGGAQYKLPATLGTLIANNYVEEVKL